MGQEASKTKALWDDYEWSLLQGKGLEIGSGGDPISDSVDTFDIEDGDANNTTRSWKILTIVTIRNTFIE